ncbi:Hypothetical protein D9617_1g088230 [Elsinoe fawcettii]|nr:Hypothetical protein D9617_1g088230 [Elsinoe fawcettii]
MSEYWKSTPKYWCKFCKLYVRDTTLEKKQHEQTGKHQSAIQKSLRDLHKNQSREEREAQRAKDELKRITGAVDGKGKDGAVASGSGSGKVGAVGVSVAKARPHFTRDTKVASVEERKKQAEQLAKMGVAVPDHFRGDMAIAGEWSTVEVRRVYETPVGVKKEEDGEEGQGKEGLFEGVKRRRVEDEDEDGEQDRVNSKRKVWGTTLKSYPGVKGGDGENFDALFSGVAVKKEVEPEVKEETTLEDGVKLKKEELIGDEANAKDVLAAVAGLSDQKQDEAAVDAPVVFKKRKGKR